jgi:hypothetical protein
MSGPNKLECLSLINLNPSVQETSSLLDPFISYKVKTFCKTTPNKKNTAQVHDIWGHIHNPFIFIVTCE